jgi:uncharacterized phage protein gp47/JayE
MKTQTEIEQSISQLFFSLQDKITTYGKTSAIRALIVSVSALIADLWNEVIQTKRGLFWSTATSTYLDDRGNEIGLQKYGAVNLSVILVFSSNEVENNTSTSVGSGSLTDSTKTWIANGFAGWKLYDSAGTQFTIISNTPDTITVSGNPASGVYYIFPVVPINTAILSNISGIKYLTTTEVVVGLSNPSLLGKSNSIPLGNRTIATCEVAGNEGKVQANELTVFQSAIPGVTAVTNPTPSQPRTSVDVESDDAFRQRASNLIASLDIGTQAFYESLAVRGNSKVLRAVAKKIPLSNGTRIYIATRSGEELTDQELSDLSIYIYDRSRAFDVVECLNMLLTDIFINYECYLPPDVVLADYYQQVADTLAGYLDYSKWNPSDMVVDDNILVEIKSVNMNVDVHLDTFTVEASKGGFGVGGFGEVGAGEIFVGSKRITLVDSLPRFARLKIKDISTDNTVDYLLNSYPISEQNNPLLNPYAFQ